jgi:6-phosphogluconolactonase (cycloisomerase 2 family)
MWLAGTYTADMDGTADGILTLSPRADGSLALDGLFAAAASPSFVTVEGQTVYAVAEAAGSLSTFTRDGTPIASTSAGGDAPCHVGVYGSTVIVSNYVSGSLGVISAEPLALVQRVDADGSGPHAVQEGPHAHATLQLADGRILSADLGADRIHLHTLVDGVLTRTGSFALPAGTGPRDLAQLDSGRVVVLAELSLEILVLDLAGDELSLAVSEPIPGGVAGDHAAGLSFYGDFVYAALRGSNRIGVVAVLDGGAALVGVDSISSAGDWPRHHVIDGDVLHVANQLSSTVASFRIDRAGIPRLIAEPTPVPSPTYLVRF